MTKKRLYDSELRQVIAIENEVRKARKELADVQTHSHSRGIHVTWFDWNKVISALRKREAQILNAWS